CLRAGPEVVLALLEARCRRLARVVLAHERRDLRVVDALVTGRTWWEGDLAGRHVRIALAVARGDGRLELIEDRLRALVPRRPTALDAGMIPVSAQVLGGLEVLRAGREAGQFARLRGGDARLRILAPRGLRTCEDAVLELLATVSERRLRHLARMVA